MKPNRFALFGVVTVLLLCGTRKPSEAAIGDNAYCEDFEGATPYTFTSDHDFFAPPAASNNPSPLWDTLTYSVDTDPINWHAYWTSFGDHTSGTGNMMIVNAADAGANCDATVFQRPGISVYPNTTYTVSYWVALAYAEAPPGLTTSVNGADVGSFEV